MNTKRRVGLLGWIRRILSLCVLGMVGAGGWWFYQYQQESEVLRKIVTRLTAEERVADVWVDDYVPGENGRSKKIRLKVLEYASDGRPLTPVYCDFSLNDVIHFEALVIRLNDDLIMQGKGKSVYLFRRAFALDDQGNTYESCDLNPPMKVPGGYRIGLSERKLSTIENEYWRSFWEFALDEKRRDDAGIKIAQIEAPATRFLPDNIYRLILERDGGMYIKASKVPEILKGEYVKIHKTSPSEENEKSVKTPKN